VFTRPGLVLFNLVNEPHQRVVLLGVVYLTIANLLKLKAQLVSDLFLGLLKIKNLS
jgi:hypothetical protein